MTKWSKYFFHRLSILKNGWVKFLFVTLLLHCFQFKNSNADHLFKEIDYIPVSNGTHFLKYPWAGGLNSAQFVDLDLNNDGKRDLVVYEKSENRCITFIAGEDGEYHLNKDYIRHIPPIQGWLVNKDMNCDGVDELFTYNNGSIMIYRGRYEDDTLRFDIWTEGINYLGYSGQINLYSTFVDRPAIADFDYDGDLDILTFNVSANRMLLYKNMQKEYGLDCDSFAFILKDNCWGNVYESGLSPMIEMRDTCEFKLNHGKIQQRHAGSTLEAYDIRNRGVLDILMGDASLTLLNHLKNDGDREYASILGQDTAFPSYDIPVKTYTFPLSTFIDVDHDGKKDLLVTPFEGLAVDNVDNVLYYKNIGTDTLQLKKITNSWLVGDMIDQGENVVPTSMDINGDGLLDILIGGNIRKKEQLSHSLTYYKNIGSNEYPIFILEEKNFLNFATTGMTFPHPHAGDLDGDGKTDLLIGTGDGRIQFYKNIHSGNGFEAATPIFLTHQGNHLDVGQNAAPFVTDYDGDGKKDLFIGEFNGNINLYKNLGNIGQINLQFITDSVGKINTQSEFLPFGYSNITIADMDKDGKLDAVIGGYDHLLLYVSNIQDSILSTVHPVPLFPEQPSIGRKTAPSFQHFTKDQEGTLLLGLMSGGVRWYSVTPPAYRPVSVKNRTQNIEVKIYPNPFHSGFQVYLPQKEEILHWEVIDVLGRKIALGIIESQNTFIPTTDWSLGAYIFIITDGHRVLTQQTIIKSL